MNLGFDAKRAFLNPSGLGNYSRTLLKSLFNLYPENNYSLFTKENSNSDFLKFIAGKKNIFICSPQNGLAKMFPSLWRSFEITGDLVKRGLSVYHGLSNELPLNIGNFKGKKIVTVHDLLFLRYPGFYSITDRIIYRHKTESACRNADSVISVSEQTKLDLMEYLSVPEKKIKVIHQGCSESFFREPTSEKMENVKAKYKLPSSYLLSVGTIEERKNLVVLIKALRNVRDIPLFVIGKKTKYILNVLSEIKKLKLEDRVFFTENVDSEDLPFIYRSAEVFVYPSLFEGFGIPVIEALASGTPVITSRGSCFPEAGGPGSVYVNPEDPEELSSVLNKILFSAEIKKKMSVTGYEHSKKFHPELAARRTMQIYLDS